MPKTYVQSLTVISALLGIANKKYPQAHYVGLNVINYKN